MFQKVKGFRDIFGDEIAYWQKLERIFAETAREFGYEEFKLPVLEKTDVFNRGIGNTTDIVEKEMFSFEDHGGESVSLRPEGTASLVRAYIENKLSNPQGLKKYWYYGPMFRRERPQKGRFRQFYQFGIEAFEMDSPLLDAEIMVFLKTICEKAGIGDGVRLEINSIGCPECRPAYSEKLISYFRGHAETLCADCQRRLEKNPLRILDCKVDRCKEIAAGAPLIVDHLCEGCSTHFSQVQGFLQMFGTDFTVNPAMVRGLDYYVRTAFEMVTGELGAASAVGAGGRYDGLVKILGGPDVPGIGFAMGVDRLAALMQTRETLEKPRVDVFIVCFEDISAAKGIELLGELRGRKVSAELDYELKGMKNQMKKANRSNARFVIILGDEEMAKGAAGVKNMMTGEQTEVPIARIAEFIAGTILEERSC